MSVNNNGTDEDESLSSNSWKTYKKINTKKKKKKAKLNFKFSLTNGNRAAKALGFAVLLILLIGYFNPLTKSSAYVLTLNDKKTINVGISKKELNFVLDNSKSAIEAELAKKINEDVKQYVEDNEDGEKFSRYVDRNYKVEVDFSGGIDYKKLRVPKDTISRDKNTILAKIEDNIAYEVKSFNVYVDEKKIASLPSKGMAEDLLNHIKDEAYTLAEDESEDDILRDFVQNVELREENLDKDKLMKVSRAYSILTEATNEPKVYIVEKGDYVGKIAEKNKMGLSELLRVNPGKTENSLIKPGQEFNIVIPKPFLSVVVRKKVIIEERMEMPVERIPVKNKTKGYHKVIKKGAEGLKEVEMYIVYTDGIETGKEIINEIVKKEPVKEVIEEGTLALTSRSAKGSFVSPIKVKRRVSSAYGMRNGKLHRGVDFAINTGTGIYASYDGTVKYSGWHYSYGYVVYVKHENGFETRYAHNSKLKVKAGQKVKTGDLLALSGNTGNSTGPHLHFEIRRYGNPSNPLNYIS